MTIRRLGVEDVRGAVALQRACFPAPFPEEYLWRPEHLLRHIELFPEGQFVAIENDVVIGSASSCRISEARWSAHLSWDETVGGPFLENHDFDGSTVYGLDISVHPAARGRGVGRALYEFRFNLVRTLGALRYGTACRLPDYSAWSKANDGSAVERYVEEVVSGRESDRTLTPLLRYGLAFIDVIHDYMQDEESSNAAALLEWKP